MSARIKTWSAIIPLKPPGQRKTRLAARFSAARRDVLAQKMFLHVAEVLRAVPDMAEVLLLSDAPLPGWEKNWILDQGRGLNAELSAAARACRAPHVLVIHADLPLLTVADVLALTQGGTGAAIAPDRHWRGTNAVALRDAPNFHFAFGENSFERHLALATSPMRVVTRAGLALDVDTPADFDLAFPLPLVLGAGVGPGVAECGAAEALQSQAMPDLAHHHLL
jgi:2-phospho-L-lactate guanylyltransferase